MQVQVVIAGGTVLFEEGAWSVPLEPRKVLAEFDGSVHLPRAITAEDFVVRSNGNPSAQANVIGVVENQAPTLWLKRSLPVRGSAAQIDLHQDVAKVAIIDRHHRSGRLRTAVSGFGFGPRCAVASTVAHDRTTCS